MIEWITIRNLALVEEADIEFGSGFNVVTGESGAGKSVIMSAISLLLGERAGKNILRTGANRCEICSSVSLSGSVKKLVATILIEADIAENEGNSLLLKRIITSSGTRNFVNDTPVTLRTLKQLGDLLIDIHGPHEHQSLLKTSAQLNILDNYGDLLPLRTCTEKCWDELQSTRRELENLEKNFPSAVEAEHLRTIISAIETAAIQEREDEAITEKHKLAANSRDLLEAFRNSVTILNESEESVADKLAELRRGLAVFEKLELKETKNYLQHCDELIESCRELAFDIENFAGTIELDEREFVAIEERLSIIQNLKRKYGPTLEDVIKTAEDARKKLEKAENFEDIRSTLQEKEKNAFANLKKSANELSEKRKKVSVKFAKLVEKSLQTLGFTNAGFHVDFLPIEPSRRGSDAIEFMFTANPGEPRNPLRKVASSGEISRVMLALKTVLADADSVPVLVFDEIDVNIGGKTALTVGKELKALSRTHQLFCISHLPQVAAAADRHYKVEKIVKNGRTLTSITLLELDQRKEEISRMLGGGKAAGKHAEELIK